MNRELIQLVIQRAHACCEYCLLPQNCLQPDFQIDHIYAVQHGGQTDASNLCYCCASCNRYKGPNLSGLDPDRVEAEPTPLFHPRRDQWIDHFNIDKTLILGKTPKGRATVQVLKMNHDLYRILRQQLMELGLYPPLHLPS